MAEGGTSNDVPDSPRTPKEARLLDCSICLEQLHEPKSLPCLHSFCQECLSTFITKDLSGKMASATAFPCPVCRKLTQPVNPSEDKEKWAQQFPANVIVKDLVKSTALEQMYCKPCGKKGKPGIPAAIWCEICKAFFCEKCKVDFHDWIHEDCESVAVTGKTGITPRQVTEQIRCEKHAKEVDYYCEDHQVLGCSRCITIDHRRCDVVTTTQEYCDKLKTESRLEDRKESLQKTKEAIKLLVKTFGEKLQILLEDQNSGFDSLTDLRKQVDLRLDAMQKDITDKLVSSYKQEKENLDLSIKKCERLMSSIENTVESSETAVQRNDSVNTILMYQRGQAEMESYQNLITEIRKSFASVRIKHVVDPSLVRLDKDSPLSLGNVIIEKKPEQLPKGISTMRPLCECDVMEVGKFSIKCPSDGRDCDAAGIVYLPDDHIVVGDCNNNKIKLFTASGKGLDEMKVTGHPIDMCCVDDDTIAAAIVNSEIHIIKANHANLTLSSKIKLSIEAGPYGITYSNEAFTVSTPTDVYRVSKDGVSTKIASYSNDCYHLTCDPRTGHIYGSQRTSEDGNVAVYRLSDSKLTSISKVGLLKYVFGVDVDGDGNVYVCGWESDNVVQMSGDGTNVRELLTSLNGVDKPRAISVCGNKFVVTNQSSQNRNDVRVFELY
ncbi:transcription intermediary factor 1-alpha-like [Pecten maximus]|uniref:transcription intermediary factor 1-alpha-like n=1 Tax=Pecten maximus TaxID=6579 RepID=UPI0014584317|nr:transcription intermediary factor 1-alpha-like [Pecten maximus]